MKAKVKVKIEATAREWQLYTMLGDSTAAKAISKAASDAINFAHVEYAKGNLSLAQTANAALAHWQGAVQDYNGYGVFDTEPRDYFLDMLEKYFENIYVPNYR